VSQIARLFYQKKLDGSDPKVPLRNVREDVYELTPGYDSAYKLLSRMVASHTIRRHKSGIMRGQDLYSLYSQGKGPSPMNYEHEVACGDLYVAFQQTGKVASWATSWKPHQYAEYARAAGVNPDAMLELEGCSQVIFFEVDMGNEKYETLDHKVQKYRTLQLSTSPFAVVFLFRDNALRRCSWKERAVQFNDRVAAKHNMGRQFSAAPHHMLATDPLGAWIGSYRSPDLFSVLDLAR
jgi:hypothetical protein